MKLFVTQSALKQGAVLTAAGPGSSSQIIRIPATQNVVGGAGEGQTLQLQTGRQVSIIETTHIKMFIV